MYHCSHPQYQTQQYLHVLSLILLSMMHLQGLNLYSLSNQSLPKNKISRSCTGAWIVRGRRSNFNIIITIIVHITWSCNTIS